MGGMLLNTLRCSGQVMATPCIMGCLVKARVATPPDKFVQHVMDVLLAAFLQWYGVLDGGCDGLASAA